MQWNGLSGFWTILIFNRLTLPFRARIDQFVCFLLNDLMDTIYPRLMQFEVL